MIITNVVEKLNQMAEDLSYMLDLTNEISKIEDLNSDKNEDIISYLILENSITEKTFRFEANVAELGILCSKLPQIEERLKILNSVYTEMFKSNKGITSKEEFEKMIEEENERIEKEIEKEKLSIEPEFLRNNPDALNKILNNIEETELNEEEEDFEVDEELRKTILKYTE